MCVRVYVITYNFKCTLLSFSRTAQLLFIWAENFIAEFTSLQMSLIEMKFKLIMNEGQTNILNVF